VSANDLDVRPELSTHRTTSLSNRYRRVNGPMRPGCTEALPAASPVRLV
jgi:hypothetical protein